MLTDSESQNIFEKEKSNKRNIIIFASCAVALILFLSGAAYITLSKSKEPSKATAVTEDAIPMNNNLGGNINTGEKPDDGGNGSSDPSDKPNQYGRFTNEEIAAKSTTEPVFFFTYADPKPSESQQKHDPLYDANLYVLKADGSVNLLRSFKTFIKTHSPPSYNAKTRQLVFSNYLQSPYPPQLLTLDEELRFVSKVELDGDIVSPSFSPNGKYVTYSSKYVGKSCFGESKTTYWELFISKADGSDKLKFEFERHYEVAAQFSNDGKYLWAYLVSQQSDKCHFFKIDLTEMKISINSDLTIPCRNNDHVFSPDLSKIVSTTADAEKKNLIFHLTDIYRRNTKTKILHTFAMDETSKSDGSFEIYSFDSSKANDRIVLVKKVAAPTLTCESGASESTGHSNSDNFDFDKAGKVYGSFTEEEVALLGKDTPDFFFIRNQDNLSKDHQQAGYFNNVLYMLTPNFALKKLTEFFDSYIPMGKLAYSPKSKSLLVPIEVKQDHHAFTIDLKDPDQIPEFQPKTIKASDSSFSPNGEYLVQVRRVYFPGSNPQQKADHFVIISKLDGTLVDHLPIYQKNITGVVFSNDGNSVFVNYLDDCTGKREFVKFNLNTRILTILYQDAENLGPATAFSLDQTKLVSMVLNNGAVEFHLFDLNNPQKKAKKVNSIDFEDGHDHKLLSLRGNTIKFVKNNYRTGHFEVYQCDCNSSEKPVKIEMSSKIQNIKQ